MKTNEDKTFKYIEFLMNERRMEEKECKTKKNNFKKSASLFVARRMNAIVTHRNEVLNDADSELKELFEV